MLLTAALLSVSFAQQAAYGATYYLDATNGDDSGAGTSDAPWRTLARAYTWYSGTGAKVREGDTVLLRNGQYGQFKEDTNSGQAYLLYRNGWVTYKADAGHNPVLNGIFIQNLDKWNGQGNGTSRLRFEGLRIEAAVTIKHTTATRGPFAV